MRTHGSVRKYSDFIATHAALQNNIPTDMKTELMTMGACLLLAGFGAKTQDAFKDSVTEALADGGTIDPDAPC